MRLYLIRHGQSINNALAAAGRYHEERVADPALTEIGHQQAQQAADFLRSTLDMKNNANEFEPYDFTHLYTSAMLRALQTMWPISHALNLTPQVWIDIHEVGGLYETNGHNQSVAVGGLTRSDLEAQFPGIRLAEECGDDGWWPLGNGRETPAAFIGRAIKVALELRSRMMSRERIVLVSHAAFIDSLIKALLNQSPLHPDSLFYTHYNTAVTRIDFGPDAHYTGNENTLERLRVHYLNRVDHLPQQLRTW